MSRFDLGFRLFEWRCWADMGEATQQSETGSTVAGSKSMFDPYHKWLGISPKDHHQTTTGCWLLICLNPMPR